MFKDSKEGKGRYSFIIRKTFYAEYKNATAAFGQLLGKWAVFYSLKKLCGVLASYDI